LRGAAPIPVTARVAERSAAEHRASGRRKTDFGNNDFADFAETAGYGFASTLGLAEAWK
jgi:hypothetical protein